MPTDLDKALGLVDPLDAALGLSSVSVKPKVKTNLLDQQGITGAEVKRRAAANEPVVQSGLHAPSNLESLASSTAELVAGAGGGLGKVLSVPADLATIPLRMAKTGISTLLDGGSIGDAQTAATTEISKTPSTDLVNTAKADAAQTFKRWLGVKDGAITDTGDYLNSLTGELSAQFAAPSLINVKESPRSFSKAELSHTADPNVVRGFKTANGSVANVSDDLIYVSADDAKLLSTNPAHVPTSIAEDPKLGLYPVQRTESGPVVGERITQLLKGEGQQPTATSAPTAPATTAVPNAVPPTPVTAATTEPAAITAREARIPGLSFASVADAASAPRTLMASMDLSAPLRQGVFFAGKPRQFFPAFRDMFKAVGSEDSFKIIKDSIESRPTYDLMKKSGLALTMEDPKTAKTLASNASTLAGREEAFASSTAARIPGVRASERAYTAFLTKLRADVFDDLLTKAQAAGLDITETGELPRQISSFINTATGRGDLPKMIEDAAPMLNAIFFSPRLIASRVQLLGGKYSPINPMMYANQPAIIRKEILKSWLGFLGFGSSILGLGKLAGADVESDPRSSDFGKLRIGKTRLDVWGGFQQYVRQAAQQMTQSYKSTSTGEIKNFGEGRNRTARDSALDFAANKLSPIASFIWTIADSHKGEDGSPVDSYGRPIELSVETVERFIPMIANDAYELAKEDPKLLPLIAPAIFGMGVDTFPVEDTLPKAIVGQIRKLTNSAAAKVSDRGDFGYSDASKSLVAQAQQQGSPEAAKQFITSRKPVYVAADGTQIPIPNGIAISTLNGDPTRADNPTEKWLAAMRKQGKIKTGGRIQFIDANDYNLTGKQKSPG